MKLSMCFFYSLSGRSGGENTAPWHADFRTGHLWGAFAMGLHGNGNGTHVMLLQRSFQWEMRGPVSVRATSREFSEARVPGGIR